MTDVIYIEDAVADHPRTRAICSRFPRAEQVRCARYQEVFNPKSQSFRLQKARPALILARKRQRLVLPTPPGYGVGGSQNFYFSHMLNCVYDCRYCFLQGMYRSAHYVVFVNYEDFSDAIVAAIARTPGSPVWFFSGYDCDSLAWEPITGFVSHFMPMFESHTNAWLELRTKSTQIRMLLAREPLANVVVAFSFTPALISNALEHKVPALAKRLAAVAQLQRAGWCIGLRFDPLIYHPDYAHLYQQLIDDVFDIVDVDALHSVTTGPFRLPKSYYQTLVRLYPDEPLFAGPLNRAKTVVSYQSEIERQLMAHCRTQILQHIPSSLLFTHPVSL